MKIARNAVLGLWLISFAVLAFSFNTNAATFPFPAQTNVPYRVYQSATGKPASLKEIVEAMNAADVVFIGELHNDPVAHLLEAQLLQDAFEKYARADVHNAVNTRDAANAHARVVTLSLEMFERDTQTEVDEYLAGLITERQFLLSSRPWSNYEQDYRLLIEYARAHNLKVIAANAPERYVNLVARRGAGALNELQQAAKNWIAPLPVSSASAAYAAKFKEFLGGDQSGHMAHGGGTNANDAAAKLLEAQSLRDATMGYAIAEKLKAEPNALVLHVNGNFHSNERLGTPEQLLRYRPQTRLMIVDVVSKDAFDEAAAKRTGHAGDFTIVTESKPSTRSF